MSTASSSSAASGSVIKALKIDTRKGSVGGFELNDSIARVLTYIQMNVQVYGRIELIASKEDLRQPLFILLPDSGRFNFCSFLTVGLKLRFEAKS